MIDLRVQGLGPAQHSALRISATQPWVRHGILEEVRCSLAGSRLRLNVAASASLGPCRAARALPPSLHGLNLSVGPSGAARTEETYRWRRGHTSSSALTPHLPRPGLQEQEARGYREGHGQRQKCRNTHAQCPLGELGAVLPKQQRLTVRDSCSVDELKRTRAVRGRRQRRARARAAAPRHVAAPQRGAYRARARSQWPNNTRSLAPPRGCGVAPRDWSMQVRA